MTDRRCISCMKPMQPIKNGFHFLHEGRLFTSDLWGCIDCKRFQIHGSPGPSGFIPTVTGIRTEDPGNPNMFAILEPHIDKFPPYFQEHMDRWYPHWNWKGELNDYRKNTSEVEEGSA